MKTGGRSRGPTKKETKQVLKPVDDRKVGKRKAPVKTDNRKEKIAKKDPNKPKRPPSAFFLFLEEFRKTFKKENPSVKAVSVVGKAGGEKWKSMTAAEKASYEAKAAKRKTQYETVLTAYNNKLENAADDGDDESEKSTSEIHDNNGGAQSGDKTSRPYNDDEDDDDNDNDNDGDDDDDDDED